MNYFKTVVEYGKRLLLLFRCSARLTTADCCPNNRTCWIGDRIPAKCRIGLTSERRRKRAKNRNRFTTTSMASAAAARGTNWTAALGQGRPLREKSRNLDQLTTKELSRWARYCFLILHFYSIIKHAKHQFLVKWNKVGLFFPCQHAMGWPP